MAIWSISMTSSATPASGLAPGLRVVCCPLLGGVRVSKPRVAVFAVTRDLFCSLDDRYLLDMLVAFGRNSDGDLVAGRGHAYMPNLVFGCFSEGEMLNRGSVSAVNLSLNTNPSHSPFRRAPIQHELVASRSPLSHLPPHTRYPPSLPLPTSPPHGHQRFLLRGW